MKILFVTFDHITVNQNGATVYHQNFAKELVSRGHEVIFMCSNLNGEKVFENIRAEAICGDYYIGYYRWCDLIITVPGKMRSNPLNKPIVFIQHNQSKEPWSVKEHRVIYCAQHVKESVNYECIDSRVFWPFNRYAGTIPLPANEDGAVMLINCNQNKGGGLLEGLAKQNPNRQFIGVHAGYNTQITGKANNIRYIKGSYNITEMLSLAALLIMPSLKEGMPTLALEAMSLGVPVLGSNIPAFHELGICYNFNWEFNERLEYYFQYYSIYRHHQLKIINVYERYHRDTDGLIEWLINI